MITKLLYVGTRAHGWGGQFTTVKQVLDYINTIETDKSRFRSIWEINVYVQKKGEIEEYTIIRKPSALGVTTLVGEVDGYIEVREIVVNQHRSENCKIK